MNFHPGEFIRNLQYMGLGMLGIAVVIGVIIAVTMVLNLVTKGKSKDADET